MEKRGARGVGGPMEGGEEQIRTPLMTTSSLVIQNSWSFNKKFTRFSNSIIIPPKKVPIRNPRPGLKHPLVRVQKKKKRKVKVRLNFWPFLAGRAKFID